MDNDAPLQLVCIYTSGIQPLSLHPQLAKHDDWGIKYLAPILPQSYSIEQLQPVCMALCKEAEDFLLEDETALFCRAWEQQQDKYVSLAIFDRESTTFRRNVLVALFHMCDEKVPLLEIISRLHIDEEPLPQGLRKIKKSPQADIRMAARKRKTLTNFLAKEGAPQLEESPIRVAKVTRTSPPRSQRRSWKISRLGIIAVALVLLCSALLRWSPQNAPRESSTVPPIQNTIQTTEVQKRHYELEKLRRENIDLQQKLDLLGTELYKLRQELDQKNDLAANAGGWRQLQETIARLRDMDIPLHQLEAELKRVRQQQKQHTHVKNNLRSMLHYLKKAQIGKGEGRNRQGELVETTTLSTFELNNVEKQLEKIIREP